MLQSYLRIKRKQNDITFCATCNHVESADSWIEIILRICKYDTVTSIFSMCDLKLSSFFYSC